MKKYGRKMRLRESGVEDDTLGYMADWTYMAPALSHANVKTADGTRRVARQRQIQGSDRFWPGRWHLDLLTGPLSTLQHILCQGIYANRTSFQRPEY